MSGTFHWRGTPLPFHHGETIAAALTRAGILDLGPIGSGSRGRVFCGIGACQSCLVSSVEGAPFEACLTLAQDGMRLEPLVSENTGGARG